MGGQRVKVWLVRFVLDLGIRSFHQYVALIMNGDLIQSPVRRHRDRDLDLTAVIEENEVADILSKVCSRAQRCCVILGLIELVRKPSWG
jgi:hypothetical protein